MHQQQPCPTTAPLWCARHDSYSFAAQPRACDLTQQTDRQPKREGERAIMAQGSFERNPLGGTKSSGPKTYHLARQHGIACCFVACGTSSIVTIWTWSGTSDYSQALPRQSW